MKRIAIITNQPAPYRVDFFSFLQKHYSHRYDIYIIFSAGNEKTQRAWRADEKKLSNAVFLRSKVFCLKNSMDVHEVILSYGIGKELSAIDPDVVVSSEYNYTSILAGSWCRANGVPYISWSDGTRFSERSIGLLQKLSRKYIIKGSRAFIASSTRTKENQIYLGADEGRIHISELAVDISRYEGSGKEYREDGPLLFVGSLIKRKGLDLLLDALSLIKDRSFKLEVVGKGPDEEELKALCRELKLEDRVTFRGFVDEAALTELYEKSSLFILPTREDCFGLVTLEAMCCALPVITSKYADGSYDLVEDGKTGRITDPYDKEGFAAVIAELMDDPGKRREMGAAGKKKSAEYSFENTASGFIEALDSCLCEEPGERTIIYSSFMCSKRCFSELFKNAGKKPGQAVQKYNRLLAEGLAALPGIKVYAVSELPVTEDNYNRLFFKGRAELSGGVIYNYLPLVNKHGIKDISAVFSSFFRCLRLAKGSDNKTFFIADILNAPAALGSFLASRVSGKQYIAVVTDLPEFVYTSHDRIYSAVSSLLLRQADKYIFLTAQMNSRINPGHRPYTVIEGLADIRERSRGVPSVIREKKVVYTGSIHERYGIKDLVDGFIEAGIKDASLHIYGDGDMKEVLEEISLTHPEIIYHGNVMEQEALKAQREAFLLVNPRPSGDDYTSYSFPSKTMEYMVSGRPVLMTRLPGMPGEYYDKVYLTEEEGPRGMAAALKKILNKDGEELKEKGERARAFVLKRKNNVSQAKKLVRELDIQS
ncbi:MAG TPA: hypothetical protein DCL38_05355 [Lachnospiraceae bacterium]|nr:hypothetical protein [Lachnospiraceae bacterium]